MNFEKILPLAPALVGQLLGCLPKAPTREVVVDIPLDHEAAGKVRALAAALASRRQLQSGIEVKLLQRPGAVDELLEELAKAGVDVAEIRKAVGIDVKSNEDVLRQLPSEAVVQLVRRFGGNQ